MAPLMRGYFVLSALLIQSLSCSNADLYNLAGSGPNAPDRTALEGMLCTPPATGDTFPVKVVFAVQGGQNVPVDFKTAIIQELSNLPSRPGVKYAFVAFHSVATGIQGSFVDVAGLRSAVTQFNGYSEVGPISLRAPLRLAKTLISGDMQSGCRGEVQRTRYVVFLIFLSEDLSCNYPLFNPGIEPQCTALMPDLQACSSCELTKVSSSIRNLAETYGAGQVDIQPIYVRNTPTALAAAQAQAIALGGGTSVATATVSTGSLQTVIRGLNLTSLQQQLVLKRLIAFNRNVVSRSGELLVDSDGDGVPDRDEIALGLNPTNPDTDGDGLGDGVELKMGLDPLTPNLITGCSPFRDADGDRLNDCEERVLGTDACMGDTDGDGPNDLVEFLSGTNPLVPENLGDADRDGIINLDEIIAHTDPQSADNAYFAERGYVYSIADAPPTPDGRACYHIRVENISLVDTLARPNPPFADIPRGTNDIYLYAQFGREASARSFGVSSLRVDQVRFTPPNKKVPAGTIAVSPDDFILGK